MDDVCIIEYGSNIENLNRLKDRFPHARVLKFFSTRSIFKKILDYGVTDKQWVISDCCDYSDFDFNWEAPWHQKYQLHIWPSGKQKFGDTFLFYRSKAIERFAKYVSDALVDLEQYKDVNWHTAPVPRIPLPIIRTNDIVKGIATGIISSYYVWYTVDGKIPDIEDPCLWDHKQAPLSIFGKNKGHALVPKTMNLASFYRTSHNSQKHTEHPYTFLKQDKELIAPCDVIFISNGESNAELAWEELKHICPRAKRVSNINDREKAYHTAAELSNSDYFYAVFPKIKIDFDFSYQPDRFSEPSHYVFDNYNPINGLTYGHMGIILYNKELLLKTTKALDYTMAARNQSIPICASSSRYDNDWWSIWRTAFRESVKLTRAQSVEAMYRLDIWMNNNINGVLPTISRLGAIEGFNYSSSAKTDLTETSSWYWLQNYFNNSYQDKKKVLELL